MIADEKLLLEKLTHAKEGKEAVDEADVGGEAKRTGSLADQWESEYAARAPLDAGMVVRLRDASKLLDELSWEEVLRRRATWVNWTRSGHSWVRFEALFAS